MSDSLRPTSSDDNQGAQPLYVPIKRRSFFVYAGATAGATALLLAGCNDDDSNVDANTTVDVGAGDVGVLNYAYALEQLEAAFYAEVLKGGYFTGLAPAAAERQIFADIALHEQIHADFFKTALAGNAIKALTPNFSAINFGDRTSVLTSARAFEDLGVAAYNGAGRFITDPKFLVVAGKIVSVEARHAAIIRDLITPNSFVANDVVDFSTTSATARQERSKLPAEVLTTANTFLAEGSKVSAKSLV
ncbi:Tat (twin-arginine translocation) pathway signal sequence containing protein [Hymenobacter lapidarius]|uniref:Tat (Twin-arginine translocation) pathway signal sequence containing protein n=1 Tax=Hymenobacter lapidarius TaxID=1908237 RepID=A0A1G1T6L7_9BACT|nr:ferritin-like domain-containing protein [Hymenobacter lapidarius]OGX86523.1 Tat (twin-arginine translocation) pathway signal sequence containing protein [Hymenobacter lapidarius]